MKIGFTGTRAGMTNEQDVSLQSFLYKYEGATFIHGDCIGADAAAHEIAMELGLNVQKRPSNISSQRAFTTGGAIIGEPRAPLDRNRDIVNDCDILVAVPKGFEEERRSGTWATVRYARTMGKGIVIIWPNGQILVGEDTYKFIYTPKENEDGA